MDDQTLTPEMFESVAKLVNVPLKVQEYSCPWCMTTTKLNPEGTRHEWQCTCFKDRTTKCP